MSSDSTIFVMDICFRRLVSLLAMKLGSDGQVSMTNNNDQSSNVISSKWEIWRFGGLYPAPPHVKAVFYNFSLVSFSVEQWAFAPPGVALSLLKCKARGRLLVYVTASFTTLNFEV